MDWTRTWTHSRCSCGLHAFEHRHHNTMCMRYELIAFYEQASSRTSWLKAFVKPWNLEHRHHNTRRTQGGAIQEPAGRRALHPLNAPPFWAGDGRYLTVYSAHHFGMHEIPHGTFCTSLWHAWEPSRYILHITLACMKSLTVYSAHHFGMHENPYGTFCTSLWHAYYLRMR